MGKWKDSVGSCFALINFISVIVGIGSLGPHTLHFTHSNAFTEERLS